MVDTERSYGLEAPVLSALTQVGTTLFADLEPAPFLDTLVHRLAQAVPAASHAWLQVCGESPQTAGTDPVAAELGRLEVDLGDGPCVSALTQRRPVGPSTLTKESPWPGWAGVAREHGMVSVLAMPLVACDHPVGGLALASREARSFEGVDAAALGILCTHSAALIANFGAYERVRRVAEQLAEALGTRDVIGTAKGILMERETLDEDAAFALLRSVSQRSNRKLRDIAQALVRPQP